MALILIGIISGYSIAGNAETRPDQHIPDPYAYPGAVLWFSADHPHIWATGDEIDVGREAFALPRFVLEYADGTLRRGPGRVGKAACILADNTLTFTIHSEETLSEPLQYAKKSVAFWVKPSLLSSEPITLYSSHFSTDAGIEITASNEQTRLRAWDDEQRWESTLEGGPLVTGEWSHLVLTLDASHQYVAQYGLHFYINSQQHGPTSILLFSDLQPAMTLHSPPSKPEAEFCYDEVAIFMDPLTRHSVSDLYTYGLGRGQPEAVKAIRLAIAKVEEESAANEARHFSTASQPDSHEAGHDHSH